ncbi:MAG TPA: TlpA disulfide reductase family protein [Polyangiaceae bacterium]|jgi:peroxiredoxin|nr:TlpA disulfide reductase family protein [Polyangiaceae bacterium]
MAKSDAREAANALDVAEDAPRGSRFRAARRWVVELGLLVGLYLALTAYQERNLLRTHTEAPPFELTGLNGEHVSLESLHGKRVALHFWATWCSVCKREQGALNAVTHELAPDEAVYTVVADADDVDKVRHFVASEHLEYPVLLGTSDVLAAYHVAAFPTTYYLDAEGRVGGHTVGMATRYSIRARMGLLK